jgi:hypothetical protein
MSVPLKPVLIDTCNQGKYMEAVRRERETFHKDSDAGTNNK